MSIGDLPENLSRAILGGIIFAHVDPPRGHVNPPRMHVNPPRGHVNPPRGHVNLSRAILGGIMLVGRLGVNKRLPLFVIIINMVTIVTCPISQKFMSQRICVGIILVGGLGVWSVLMISTRKVSNRGSWIPEPLLLLPSECRLKAQISQGLGPLFQIQLLIITNS